MRLIIAAYHVKGRHIIVLNLVGCLLASLLLAACGESSTPAVPVTTSAQIVPSAPTQTIILTPTLSATATPAITATPTATATPVATVTPLPTSTPQPTATPVPTATPQPTATPMPTPTPVPVPTSLILGEENDPWGEITPYQEGSIADTFEPLPLSDDLLQSLSGLFQFAPHLGVSGSVTLLKTKGFRLRINAGVSTAFVNGLVASPRFTTAMRYGFSGGFNAGALPLKLVGIGLKLTPLGIWQLVNDASSLFNGGGGGIDQQLDTINQNILDVKQILQDQELGRLRGNYNYLNSMRTSLQQQTISDSDVEIFRQQLENIERESQQAIAQYRAVAQQKREVFEKLPHKKFIYIGEGVEKVEFEKQINEYYQNSDFYRLALMVRSLSAEIRCAIPSSRQLALSRLEEVRTQLSDWYDEQHSFNNLSESRLPELNGFMADEQNRKAISQKVKDQAEAARQVFSRTYVLYSDTIQKVRAQVQNNGASPLVLVAELDDQGQIIKISKLLSK